MRMSIPKVETRSLRTLDKINYRASDIYELFKERIADFKERNSQTNLQISISGTSPYVSLFVVSNKIVGCDYDMNVWKTVPIYKCNPQSFSDGSGYYLEMIINFCQSKSSEDWRLDEVALTQKIDSAILNAVQDFIASPSNTL